VAAADRKKSHGNHDSQCPGWYSNPQPPTRKPTALSPQQSTFSTRPSQCQKKTTDGILFWALAKPDEKNSESTYLLQQTQSFFFQ
jgi:hypothetical protein